MTEAVRWLVLDLERCPDPEAPLVREVRGLALGPARLHDAGWARYLAAPVPADLDTAAWLGRDDVRRAWLQDDDIVLTGRLWPNGSPGFAAAGWHSAGTELLLIAGPCAVESADQMDTTAAACRQAGARWLRGGAWKPRTSPYDFQGLGPRGLEMLRRAADAHDLRVVTEVIGIEELPLVAEMSDVLQVGARNAQNFPLLRALGRTNRPVLLKRGFGCTVRELLGAAEYVMAHGNPQVLVCERGIRSFEASTRFTFDINAIPLLQQSTHLPVIADPSHGTGERSLVAAVARAAVAAGADGVMIEVHDDPAHARSDGRQAVELSELDGLLDSLRQIAAVVGRPA